MVAGCAAALHPEQFEGDGVDRGGAAGLGGAGRAVEGSGEAAAAQALRRAPPAPAAGGRRRGAAATPGARTRLRAQGPGRLRRAPAATASCGWCAGGRAACRWRDALAAARAGLARGCGEVVLSGIDLGAWRDGDAAPARPRRGARGAAAACARAAPLVARAAAPRRRACSTLLAHPRVARHLHVPLQSADDGVLRAMTRPYTFAALPATRSRACGPRRGDAMLSTDVIVGYPDRGRGRLRAHAGGAARAASSGARTCSPTRRGRGRRQRSCRRCRPRVVKERMGRALAAAEAAARAARRAALGRARRGPRRGAARRPLEGVQFGVRPLLPARRRAARGAGRAVADETHGDGVKGSKESRQMSGDCIFCRIAAGDIPADVVAQDDDFVAFRDVRPLAPVHVLVIPRAHVASLDEVEALGPAGLGPRARVHRRHGPLRRRGGDRLPSHHEHGPDAGQEVLHLHWHVIGGTRGWEDDGMREARAHRTAHQGRRHGGAQGRRQAAPRGAHSFVAALKKERIDSRKAAHRGGRAHGAQARAQAPRRGHRAVRRGRPHGPRRPGALRGGAPQGLHAGGARATPSSRSWSTRPSPPPTPSRPRTWARSWAGSSPRSPAAPTARSSATSSADAWGAEGDAGHAHGHRPRQQQHRAQRSPASTTRTSRSSSSAWTAR